MRRFLNYDRVQQMRDDAEDAKVKRDEWLRDKADELSREFPDCAMSFYNTGLRFSPFRVGLDSDKAQEAYEAFVESVCMAQAEKLYSDLCFLGEVA